MIISMKYRCELLKRYNTIRCHARERESENFQTKLSTEIRTKLMNTIFTSE